MEYICSGSCLAMVLSLFGLSLLHEDVATVTAGFLVVHNGLQWYFAVIVLFIGSVVGDFAIYGLGALARRIPWLRRMVIGQNVGRVRQWLDRNFIRVVGLARVVPGVLFPSYIACGWFGFPFKRFARVTVVADAIYTSIAFAIVVTLGETVLKHLGYVAWGVLIVFILALTIVRTRNPHWSTVAAVSERHPYTAIRGLLKRKNLKVGESNEVLAKGQDLKARVASAERIPPWLFYIPVGLCWLVWTARHRGIMLPCGCNPNIETGGFWGESKSGVLDQIGSEQQQWIAKYVSIKLSPEETDESKQVDFDRAVKAIGDAGLEFPLVVKPDIGWQGFGVRLVPDIGGLREYLSQYPAGERVVFQKYLTYEGEAGVFYARIPGEETGSVISLTLRTSAHVVGDGKSTVRELIQKDERARFKSSTHMGRKSLHSGMEGEDLDDVPAAGEVVQLAFIGSIRAGGLYEDARDEITPELSARFDAIARTMPEFHYGRFDIRYESLERLKKGENFGIIEVNGAGAEAIHIWDPDLTLREVYSSLFAAVALQFRIGRLNRDRGFKPCSTWEFLNSARRQHKLILRYPPST